MSKQKIREWLKNNYTLRGEWIVDLIDEYTKDQSEWVSVDDRLPESHLEYLVYDGSDVYECLLIRDKWDTTGTVTHWQPLPLPPTQEG